MQIDAAEIKDGKLVLSVPYKDARPWVMKFKPGEYDIAKATKKRSLNANAYAWDLIGKIAAAMAIDRYTIYQDAVKAVGPYTQIVLNNEAVDEFARFWGRKGLGWVVTKLDERNGKALINAYQGSSEYDVTQMSQFIDYLSEDARSLGIETLDEQRLNSLLEAWDQ